MYLINFFWENWTMFWVVLMQHSFYSFMTKLRKIITFNLLQLDPFIAQALLIPSFIHGHYVKRLVVCWSQVCWHSVILPKPSLLLTCSWIMALGTAGDTDERKISQASLFFIPLFDTGFQIPWAACISRPQSSADCECWSEVSTYENLQIAVTVSVLKLIRLTLCTHYYIATTSAGL